MRYFEGGVKAPITPEFGSYPDLSGTIDYRYNIDYSQVGQYQPPTEDSAVVAVLQVLANRFPEPPIKLYTDDDDQVGSYNHPAVELFNNINPYMTPALFWHYVMYAVHLDGNAYAYKTRSRTGQVVELHPLLPELVTPEGSERTLITHYKYHVRGQEINIPARNMWHYRIGVDPLNHRLGLGPLKAAYREIWGDLEAAKFANALMRNAGVAPVIFSPKDDEGPDEDEGERIIAAWEERVTGSNRGRAAFLSGPVEVHRVAFSPRDLDMTALRRLPEERVAAVCGVPPILANLGAGLEKSSGRNETRELIEAFTEGTLIPQWRGMGQYNTKSILQDFSPGDTRQLRFDLKSVRALQPDRDKLFNRLTVAVNGLWMTVEEARMAAGMDREPDGEYVERAGGSPEGPPPDTEPDNPDDAD